MAGIGVPLELGHGSGLWTQPAGSASAAGLFAGWLAGTMAVGSWQPGEPFPRTGAWAPWPAAEGFVLTLDNAALPGSAFAGADRMVRRALGLEPIDAGAVAGTPTRILDLTATAIPLPADTLPTVVASLADEWPPLPDVLPCVPCASPRPPSPPPKPADIGASEGTPLVIDLSASGGIAGFYQLSEVALRIGETVYQLDGGDDAALLTELTDGTVTTLAIAGLDLTVIAMRGESLSLVFLLAYDGIPFWHATPLAIGFDL
jgi:hypothetical protein